MGGKRANKKKVEAPILTGFPCLDCLPGCSAESYIRDVQRLLRTNLDSSQYIDVTSSRRLIASMLRAYTLSQTSPRWQTDEFLARLRSDDHTLAKVFAAIFDFATNVEYCSGRFNRVSNSKWIYCNAAKDGVGGTTAGTKARVFYSFLKQCPYCCLESGLEARIRDSQHKPQSHHIGEITGFIMSTLLQVVLRSGDRPLNIGLIANQHHDIDAVAFGYDLAVLIEIKASPLVTLPLASDLNAVMLKDAADDSQGTTGAAAEYDRHSLIDFPYKSFPLYFFVAHRNLRIELGHPDSENFPYEKATAYVAEPDGFLNYLSAWAELFEAFAVPKRERRGRVKSVAFLTNGWGDDIDSNKTKPGLGRTDDTKKGTYQMLKYGAYYKDLCKRRAIYSALAANLDPVNLWAQYLERLLDVRWTKEQYVEMKESYFQVPRDRFYYLFEAIIAFNNPVINEPALREVFDFERADGALKSGALISSLLDGWLV
jgi:hypothetical protein